MIQRYTIKFAPAVNQKELEKLLQTDGVPLNRRASQYMKARTEVQENRGTPQTTFKIRTMMVSTGSCSLSALLHPNSQT